MIATELSLPETLWVLRLPPPGYEPAVACWTLMELELRGLLRCSWPEHEGLRKLLVSRFYSAFVLPVVKLEVLDDAATGDVLLDATLAAVSLVPGWARSHMSVLKLHGATAKIQLSKCYADRLVADGWLRLKRERRRMRSSYEVANQAGVEAMKHELLARLLDPQPLDPRDEALVAFLAAGGGWTRRLMPEAELAGLDHKGRRQKRRQANRRAVEAMNSIPLAHQLRTDAQWKPG